MAAEQETWETALDRLALLLGGRSEQFRAEAEEWLRQSLAASYRVSSSLHDLTRAERQVAFQRTIRVVYDLAGEGEIAFAHDVRALVAETFARHFGTEPTPGPDWRLAPTELDRPTYAEASDDSLPI